MKTILSILALPLLTLSAHADPQCTEVPKAQWKSEQEFQNKVKAEGYKIKKFKVTRTSCYEIYGWDRAGKKVEIYYNPVTFEPVKTKTW